MHLHPDWVDKYAEYMKNGVSFNDTLMYAYNELEGKVEDIRRNKIKVFFGGIASGTISVVPLGGTVVNFSEAVKYGNICCESFGLVPEGVKSKSTKISSIDYITELGLVQIATSVAGESIPLIGCVLSSVGYFGLGKKLRGHFLEKAKKIHCDAIHDIYGIDKSS